MENTLDTQAILDLAGLRGYIVAIIDKYNDIKYSTTVPLTSIKEDLDRIYRTLSDIVDDVEFIQNREEELNAVIDLKGNEIDRLIDKLRRVEECLNASLHPVKFK